MKEDSIRIELRSRKGAKQALDEPLELSIQITNVSTEPILMVGVLPGSDGLRFPQYLTEIEGPSGPVDLTLPEYLDYARGLQVEDFVRLAPGETFDPQAGEGFIPIQQLAWFKPDKPGTYYFKLRFDATASDPRQWMGSTQVRDWHKIEELIKRVPSVAVWSNTLAIECM